MEGTQQTRATQAVVVSRSGNKSITVRLDYLRRHPKYSKYIRRRTKLGVHDEQNVAGVGDVVEIVPCRPRSQRKSWRLVKVVHKAVVE